jgi:hypothetical protein
MAQRARSAAARGARRHSVGCNRAFTWRPEPAAAQLAAELADASAEPDAGISDHVCIIVVVNLVLQFERIYLAELVSPLDRTARTLADRQFGTFSAPAPMSDSTGIAGMIAAARPLAPQQHHRRDRDAIFRAPRCLWDFLAPAEPLDAAWPRPGQQLSALSCA